VTGTVTVRFPDQYAAAITFSIAGRRTLDAAERALLSSDQVDLEARAR